MKWLLSIQEVSIMLYEIISVIARVDSKDFRYEHKSTNYCTCCVLLQNYSTVKKLIIFATLTFTWVAGQCGSTPNPTQQGDL